MSQEVAGRRIALGISGGIAAYKAAEILRGLQRAGCAVRVAMTARACEFITPLTFRALSGAHVITDDYAPDNPDPIAHITFSQTVDLLLVAPATANIIAKFAHAWQTFLTQRTGLTAPGYRRHDTLCESPAHSELTLRGRRRRYRAGRGRDGLRHFRAGTLERA